MIDTDATAGTAVLPDRLQADISAMHGEEQRRKEDNLRWLMEHCRWKPFGAEW